MHQIQESLLKLSKEKNLAKVTLREMAKLIGSPNESPQKIKHHLIQLQKKGFLTIDKIKGVMRRSASVPSLAEGFLDKPKQLFSIPVIGAANCGPATIFAEENFEGFLKISSRLIGRSKPHGLFAIKVDGTSMNRANINGNRIEDGDHVVIDSGDKIIKTGDVVLSIIDNKATIKRFIDDRKNGQIVLMADSSFDYEPIYIHPDDDFNINGKAISVIKKPRASS